MYTLPILFTAEKKTNKHKTNWKFCYYVDVIGVYFYLFYHYYYLWLAILIWCFDIDLLQQNGIETMANKCYGKQLIIFCLQFYQNVKRLIAEQHIAFEPTTNTQLISLRLNFVIPRRLDLIIHVIIIDFYHLHIAITYAY